MIVCIETLKSLKRASGIIMKSSFLRLMATSCLGLLVSFNVFSAEDAPTAEVLYFDLDPNIITNYQKPNSRRLGFVTVDVQFQVLGADNMEILEAHQPLIENVMVDILNALTEEKVKDITMRGEIREQIKTQLSEALTEEVGIAVIDDVLFTKFFYQ